MKKEDLDREFSLIHDRVTELFYQKKSIDHEEFQRLHSACWLYHEKAKIEHKHEEDIVSEPGGLPRSQQIDEQLAGLQLSKHDWQKHGSKDPEEFLPTKEPH